MRGVRNEWIGVVLLALACGGNAGNGEARPNFLILIADDQTGATLGAAGDPVARTPRLDALAAEGVRFSNAELPFFDFLRNAGPLKEPGKAIFKAIAEVAVGAKIDMELELRWAEDEVDGLRLLAFSPTQAPINRHPVTGLPSWFCNVHSHSRYLRDQRDGDLPDTTGASKLNRTDMFYGDLSDIAAEDLQNIDEVTRKNLVSVLMEPGDVVLVDNYQVMHGRDVFEGERLHAVTWFQ